jgi:hypothetical protein
MSNLRLLDPTFGDNFESALRRFFPPTLFDGDAPQLKMRIDVSEGDKAYTVKADIPGAKKEDINVQVDGNVVSIRAETRSEKETREGDRLLRSERHVTQSSAASRSGRTSTRLLIDIIRIVSLKKTVTLAPRDAQRPVKSIATCGFARRPDCHASEIP